MKPPILKGDRVILKSLSIKDAPFFISWFGDKEVVRYLLVQKPVSLPEEKKWIKDSIKAKDKVVWSIWVDGKLIGNCMLRLDPKNKAADLGLVIGDKKEWGKGYAPEVVGLLGGYTFTKLKFNRFSLTVHDGNTRAIKAYKKVGFKEEGRLRKAHWNLISKSFEDQILMSILKEEWIKNIRK